VTIDRSDVSAHLQCVALQWAPCSSSHNKCILLKESMGRWVLFSPCLTTLSGLAYATPFATILPPCPPLATMLQTLPTLQTLPCITNNTKWQCMTTSLPEPYTVRDKRLAVTHLISQSLRPAYNHRCLYHGLPYLGLYPPVSCAFMKGWTIHADMRWLSGANRVSLRLRLECSCLESRL
jgi:hypothetical protein